MKHLGDISKINGADIEPVDVITFGSPCQDLSIAGKRAGLKHEENGDEETTRSGLFMEAVRIIKEMRAATNGKYPRFALWENVPGAFSSNKGEDFRIVCEELIKIVEPSAVMPEVPKNGWAYADSYIGDGWSLAYRVFDAQYWGVPQRRRRIHLIADFRGECAREILFEREGVRGYFETGRTPWQTITTNAERCSGADDSGTIAFAQNQRDEVRDLGDKAGALQAQPGMKQQTFLAQPVAGNLILDDQGGQQITVRTDGIAPTLRAETHGNLPCVMGPAENFLDVEMEVATRKYEVNTDKLVAVLRSHKNGFSNKEIAEKLNCPITKVEHWFRTDNCFAIPDPELWSPLKKLLGIETDEFDQSITEFEFKGGNYDLRNRIHIGETTPTLTCGCGNNLHLVPENPTVIECAGFKPNQGSKAGGIGFEDEISPTLLAGQEPGCVYCLQGNGIDRADTARCNGKGWKEDTSYTLNTVDRPAVASDTNDLYEWHNQDSRITGPIDVACTLNTNAGGREGHLVLSNAVAHTMQGFGDYKDATDLVVEKHPRYIVRRLTPTECARLQGFADHWGDVEPKTEFSDAEYKFWLDVRNTHAAINGRAVKEYTEKQMLTWYNKLHTDSAEYKMWGNGIALPPALYCMQGIVEAINK
jgi:DNA (cytosine-5)-methyltransferase 1